MRNLPGHPNGMRFETLDEQGNSDEQWQVYSIGGGALQIEGEEQHTQHLYPLRSMNALLQYCTKQGIYFWEYVEQIEGADIWDFLLTVLNTMWDTIERGLKAEGVLPGGLGVSRKASVLRRKIQLNGENFLQKGFLPAYALAVTEENAARRRGCCRTDLRFGGCAPGSAALYSG